MRLTARKPSDPAYPKEIRTLGDHLRKRRLDLGLRQRQVALTLGVDAMTVNNWEVGRTAPKISFIPSIYDFLGYGPWEPPEGFGRWLGQVRRGLGLSRRKLAQRLAVDVTTVDRWERGKGQPSGQLGARLRTFVRWNG